MGHPHADRPSDDGDASPHGRDYGERPLVVAWELTRACGLSCDHCRAEATPDRHSAELTTAEARELFGQVAAFGEPAPFLSSPAAIPSSDRTPSS